jgi:hypothetical protein
MLEDAPNDALSSIIRSKNVDLSREDRSSLVGFALTSI